MSLISTAGLDLDDPALERRLELLRGPTGAWRIDRDVQVRALATLGLQPHHRLVEIGCGPLLAGAPLIRFLDPGHYTGVDVSADRLAAAHDLVDRLGLRDRGPRLIRSDDFGLDQLAPASMDRLWSFHVVIHLTAPLIARFLAAAATLLVPGGIGWFSAWVAGDAAPFTPLGKWLEFPVTEAGSDTFVAAAREAGLNCRSLGTLESWGLPADRPAAQNWLFEVRR